MKKILIMAVMACLTATATAQDVFRLLLEESKAVAEDRSKDMETRKIATFKYDVLSYMAMQVRDDVLRDSTDLAFFNKTVTMLNEQALALHEFVSFYLERVNATNRNEERQLVMMFFSSASINYPLFNDPDKDLVLSYYNNENYITRFSLDTDWVKALALVRQRKSW